MELGGKNEVCLVLIDGQSASHFAAWIIIPNRDCLPPFMYPLSRFFHPWNLRRFPPVFIPVSHFILFSESSPSACFFELYKFLLEIRTTRCLERDLAARWFLFSIKFSSLNTYFVKFSSFFFYHRIFLSFSRYPSFFFRYSLIFDLFAFCSIRC